MWSVEVGIHRSPEGQSDRLFASAAAAVAADDDDGDELISSAILAANSRDNLDNRRRPILIRFENSKSLRLDSNFENQKRNRRRLKKLLANYSSAITKTNV